VVDTTIFDELRECGGRFSKLPEIVAECPARGKGAG